MAKLTGQFLGHVSTRDRREAPIAGTLKRNNSGAFWHRLIYG